MNVYTIGFTQKSARQFFVSLKAASIKRLVDVRTAIRHSWQDSRRRLI